MGDPLPPLWHWLYFLPRHRQSELAPDGHAQRGGFLPPVSLPRRMWAGGRFEFHHPLCIGERITRVSRIADVTHKQGRTGDLIFILVRHEISDAAGLALVEEQDIVYRGHSSSAPPPPAPPSALWSRTLRPDDVLLFRYSSLTFNSHRIHYDRRYAVETEGYPGLVVHGPLIATLLLDLVHRNLPQANVSRFSFRAVSPLFDTTSFTVCGQPDGNQVRLWAKNETGGLAMEAIASLA
jgi:3-methylfumaryl-CoA hydratase